MAIRVKFFASLREALPNAVDEVAAEGLETVSDVWARATEAREMPAHVLCSVNLEHRSANDPVDDGDEVAFFPPVTGG